VKRICFVRRLVGRKLNTCCVRECAHMQYLDRLIKIHVVILKNLEDRFTIFRVFVILGDCFRKHRNSHSQDVRRKGELEYSIFSCI